MSVESIALVLNHSRSEGIARLVLIGIANHDGDGGSWPAVKTLAKYANVSERTVQRYIRVLVDLGELAVYHQEGGTMNFREGYRPNRYEITLIGSGVTDVSPHTGSGVTETPIRGDRNEVRGDRNAVLGVTPAVTLTVLEPSIVEPSNKYTPEICGEEFGSSEFGDTGCSSGSLLPAVDDSPGDRNSGFELFWEAYPKKTAKQDAIKAWGQVMRKAGGTGERRHLADVIVSGAVRYASDPNLPDRQYVPYPAKWLRQGQWEDEPCPPPPRQTPMATTDQRVAQGLALAEKFAAEERNAIGGAL